MTYLSVSYTCTGCWEDAESDGDCGLICRRCSVVFDGYADGDEGRQLTPGEFTDNYGSHAPEPTARERLAATLAEIRARKSLGLEP